MNAHCIHAVIGHRDNLETLCQVWQAARLQYLPQDFALCLVGERLRQEIEAEYGAQVAPFPQCPGLPAGLYQLVLQASQAGPLVYLETDYQGGAGQQVAMAFDGGELVFGPRQTQDASVDHLGDAEFPEERAVNAALAHLGVWSRGTMDAWDTLELYKFRRNPP